MSEENFRTPKQTSILTATSPLSSGSKCKRSSGMRTVTPTILAYSPSYIRKNIAHAMHSTFSSSASEWPRAPPCSPISFCQVSASLAQPNENIELSAPFQSLAINRIIKAAPIVLSIDAVDERGMMVTTNIAVDLSLTHSGVVELKPCSVRLNGSEIWSEKK